MRPNYEICQKCLGTNYLGSIKYQLCRVIDNSNTILMPSLMCLQKIPKKCPYKLEHIIMHQKEEKTEEVSF